MLKFILSGDLNIVDFIVYLLFAIDFYRALSQFLIHYTDKLFCFPYCKQAPMYFQLI